MGDKGKKLKILTKKKFLKYSLKLQSWASLMLKVMQFWFSIDIAVSLVYSYFWIVAATLSYSYLMYILDGKSIFFTI